MNEKFTFPHPHGEQTATCACLYREAFRNNTDCLAFYTLSSSNSLCIHEVNPAFERLLGQSKAKLLGRCLEEFVPETIARRITADGRTCIATNTSLNAEYELELVTGRRYFLHSLIPVHDEFECTIRLLHVARDITTSKHHEQQLLSDRLAFRNLAENTPDSIARYDPDLLRTYANPALARMAGVAATSLLGKPPSHTNNAPEMLAYETTLLEVLRSGQPSEHMLTWPDAYGCMITSHIRIVPERVADGSVVSVLAVGRDITQLRRTEQELRIREQEFRTLVDNSPDVIVRYDPEGRRIYVNPAFERLHGVVSDEFIVMSQELTSCYHKSVLSVLRSLLPTAIEASWTNSNGEQIVQHIQAVPEFDQHGQISSILTIARDISALKATERRLEQAEAMARLGHWQLDYRLGILRLSVELCRMVDKPRDWSPTQNDALSMILLKDRGRVLELIYQAISERCTTLSLDYRILVGGQHLHLHSDMSIEYDADGTPLQVLGTVQDISELKAYQQRLHALAFYDTLTELPNRALFKERLQQALTQAEHAGYQVVVAILDLDHFKAINDTFGQEAGDKLLCDVAKRLRRFVCGSDSVARLGGDEFALILPSELINPTDCYNIGKKVLQAITGVYRIQDQEVFVSGSLGIARSQADADSIRGLLQYADSAMHHAKSKGRNNIQLYSPHLTLQTKERLALAASLRHAQHNDELTLHYQPQIDLTNGSLIGAEALLRWNHPQHGQVPPDKFIPIAEDTGLIIGIGEWILGKACRCAAAWNRDDRYPPLKIAVNLSPRQFQMNDLLASIRAILQDTDCKPEWLELEITEGLLLDNSNAVRETLKQLNTMGLSIALDDFGTGYSALSYLNLFPIKTLKIDRSFIHDIAHDRDRAELVKAIISMAHSLRLSLVAEGVEEAAQQTFLQRYGCHSAQGYLYGKPMSQEDFENFLLSQTEDNSSI